MLKYLTSIAALFLVLSVFVTAKYQPACENNQATAKANVPAVTSQVKESQSGSKSDSGEHQKDCPTLLYKFFAWPEGFTVWALLLTLVAFVWQASLMEKHAGHFRDLAQKTADSAVATQSSADAIRVQAEISRKAFVSQFRPKVPVRSMWLLEKDGALTIEIWLTNIGGTTAKIIGSNITVGWEVPRELKKELLASTVFEKTSLGAGRDHSASVDITQIAIPYGVAKIAGDEGRDQEAWISCLGRLTYEDDNGAYRSTGFYRKYDIRTKRFIPSDDPEEEYCD